ncbi:UNVERIFIED_CONTAM: hypothetical protein GTU68_058771 [Idotea baltica]|nr:hypothetical protein [Idotea baltica]
MARYTGPKTKIARKFGEAIFGYDKSFERKKYPPGQHGNSRKRKSNSDYGVQLKEKQKAKHTYGLLEKQFRNLFIEANRRPGVTGTNLLQMLESRLDNVVFRMGLAASRRGARQLVGHKHIMLNGQNCNIPSAVVKPGDVISIREKSKDLHSINDALNKKGKQFPWIEWDREKHSGRLITLPEREEIPENINEQLIVELYSK